MSRQEATPYHKAALTGDLSSLSVLLNGPDNIINAADENGDTVLHVASSAGQLAVVQSLLKAGASVNAKARKRVTPLHIAARFGRCDVIEALVEGGARKNRRDIRYKTPLMYASRFGQEEAVATLLRLGCDVTYGDMFERTALHWAVKEGTESLVKILHQGGADLNAGDKFGKTPIIEAVKANKLDILKYLLAQGVDLREEERFRRNVLHMAASKERFHCLEVLLRAGLQPDMVNSHGKTPLLLAAEQCNPGSLKVLLANGADVHALDPRGQTALVIVAFAAVRPRIVATRPVFDTVFQLVDGNVDVDHVTDHGLSWRPEEAHPHNALEIVAKAGLLGIAKLLARAGTAAGNLQLYFKMTTKDLPVYFQKHKLVLDWLKRYYKSPPSLKALCRVRFRRSIRSNFCRSLVKLNVPPGILGYLHFSDLADLQEEYGCKNESGCEDGAVFSEPPDCDSEAEYEPSLFDSDHYGMPDPDASDE